MNSTNDNAANDGPVIRPMPTLEEYLAMVDQVVSLEPGYNDSEIRAFINIVMTPANPEDDHSWALASVRARHAFTKTEAFEKAYREFAGWPERSPYKADRYVVHARQEM